MRFRFYKYQSLISIFKGTKMTINLTIENANEDLVRAIKSMAKAANAKITTKKTKGGMLREAIKEIERGEYETYESIEAFKKAMQNV